MMRLFTCGFQKIAKKEKQDPRPFYKRPLPLAGMAAANAPLSYYAFHKLEEKLEGPHKATAGRFKKILPAVNALSAAYYLHQHHEEKKGNK